MFKEGLLLFYVAETSIHPGSGSEVGIVDLPIQREVHTKIPIIRGSSLKGSFRDYWGSLQNLPQGIEEEKKRTASSYLRQIFGPEPEGLTEEKAFASAASFTDARVLLFPVKSFKNIFAYVTSPGVLKKFLQDLKWAGIELELSKLEKEIGPGEALAKDAMEEGGEVFLEEHRFKRVEDIGNIGKELAKAIFASEEDFRKIKVEEHLVVLSDDDFQYFLHHSTEVVARIRIDQEKGTVKRGGLWYEENLPSETILYNLVLFSDGRDPQAKENSSAKDIKEVFEKACPQILQLGGNETVGRGFLRLYPCSTKEGKNG